MAVVQPITENTVRLRPADTTPLQAADFSGGKAIGDAATRLGQQIGQSAEDLNQRNMHLAEVAARDADNRRTAAMQKLLYEGDTAFFNQQGANAVNALPALQEARRQVDDDLLKQLGHNPLAQRLYRNVAAQRDASDAQRINEHVHTEGNRYEDSVDDSTVALAATTAANNYTRPDEITRNVATATAAAARRAQRMGLTDPTQIEALQQHAAGIVVSSVAERIERGAGQGPLEALAFVEAHRDQIPADVYNRLASSLAGPAANQTADADVDGFLVTTGGPAVAAPAAGGTAAAPATGGTAAPAAGGGGAAAPAAPAATATRPPGTPATERVMNYQARAHGFNEVPADVRTLGQASDFAIRVNRAGVPSSAMGTFQIVGTTLRQYAPRVFGANWRNVTFDGAAQERIAHAIFDDHKGSAAALRGQWQSLSLAEAERVRQMPWEQARNVIAHGESGGARGSSVTGPVGDPTASTTPPEVDLQATIARINDPNARNPRTGELLTYEQRQGLIAAATRRHGLVADTIHAGEEQARDAAYTEMNSLGPSYTDYNQLSLGTRQRLAQFPSIEHNFRQAAETNQREAEARARSEQGHSESYLDLLELANNRPDVFVHQELRDRPDLTYSQRESLINRRGEIMRTMQSAENRAERVNMGQINRLVSTAVGQDPALNTHPNMSPAELNTLRRTRVMLAERVRQRAAEQLQRDPTHPLTDQQVADIIAGEVQPVTIVRPGRVWGENRTAVPRYRAALEGAADPAHTRTEVPLPQGIPANEGNMIVQAYRRTHGGQYPAEEEIIRLYDLRHGAAAR